MKYKDLRDFIAQLEKIGELKRIGIPVSTHLEMTEICDRVLREAGFRMASMCAWYKRYRVRLRSYRQG